MQPDLHAITESPEHARWIVEHHIGTQTERSRCPICETWWPCDLAGIAALAVQAEAETISVREHWQGELRKAIEVIAETGRERNALAADLTATQDTLNAAMEGRRYQIERAMNAEVEVARLREWLEPLEAWASNVLGIVKERRIPSADVIADGEAIVAEARKALEES